MNDLRVTRRKGRKGPHLTVRCRDCEVKLVIRVFSEADYLEINGVAAPRDEWLVALGPLLASTPASYLRTAGTSTVTINANKFMETMRGTR